MSEAEQDGPGAELKAAREGMDVSTREVADALNLPVHVIEALEADDYERLPPTVFTRGYLRSYARLLELSPESLLARYPEVTEELDAITGELPVAEVPTVAPTKTLGIAAVVGIVLIALLVWLLGDEEAPQPVEPRTPSAADADPEADREADRDAETDIEAGTVEQTIEQAPEVVPVLPVAEQPDVDQPPLAEAAAASSDDPPAAAAVSEPGQPVSPDREPLEVETSRPAPEPVVETSPSTDEVTPAPSAADTAEAAVPITASFRERRITEFGDDTLTFVFTEDCWVEVKSTDGENLYSDLNRAGRTLVLTGQAPFRVLLGYAPGVSLSFNGEPVPLARFSRNNVANLVLGE